MATVSEDVLLQVESVRCKKNEGTLYLMSERIAFMMDHRDIVSVSHPYTDIKQQKISPEGKAKVQLQLVLHSGETTTFQFCNSKGMDACLADRDKVKNLLLNLLPKFQMKVNKELEEKSRLLRNNPTLMHLYRDLVMAKVMTADEFWSQHSALYVNKQNTTKPQAIGVSPAFLSDIRSETDGCNGLKYKLTPDVIECIFKAYPAVHKKYMECVPMKVSEAEFWTKFFQSHYFHKDRLHPGGEDIFVECGKVDEQKFKEDLAGGISDPTVNLTRFDDGCEEVVEKSGSSSDNLGVHKELIRRFNQHSIMIMKANQKNPDPEAKEITRSEGGPPSTNSDTPTKLICPLNRGINGDRIEYPDLTEEKKSQDSNITFVNYKNVLQGLESTSASKLELKFKNGSVNMHQRNGHSIKPTSYSRKRARLELEKWKYHAVPATALVNPSSAVSALGELTPGGILMKGLQDNSLEQSIPPQIEAELRTLTRSLNELLRHFWKCFPPLTANLEQKAIRMHEALRRFHEVKMKPFEEQIARKHSPLYLKFTRHLNTLLEVAYNKYITWSTKHKVG
ncbi:unnamed protein product [Bemisia tabaci]|uniref:BSD domain-containing protein n=1 Tax=Bemisia tabaci TaxID=7038 RepID=A0A9P0AIC3_BEMTA|nr:PREDICTED: general transcription factor IIH subunit 1 [Bemisia tabaci]CAH0393714.1 unnamed protein product [Bemisia tabaci]